MIRFQMYLSKSDPLVLIFIDGDICLEMIEQQ
jgi:hypothetical protein